MTIQSVGASVFAALHVLNTIVNPALGFVDPAAMIPVVAFAPVDNNGTPDPSNWSPDSPQSSVSAALTVSQAKSDACLESNGTLVRVHDINKRFCGHGWPICNSDSNGGLCPQAQQGLPNGSHCTTLATGNSVYGCVQKITRTTPTSCRLRISTM
ncbi:unnamed protein product [Phytophthora fragariaefolia]|uniref:Unnamed protein product n=1 Tax=Phytophthora fragariaefolia TaxID=1490495 RepID=A0A9W6XUY4_9STRA|nr:unnamed protein product [Phytophthora fragariaefolia]